jgi:crossover junction endodeoxyribonuclease RuvC
VRILGIDPGLNVTGYGLLEADPRTLRIVEGGVVRTDARDPLEVRLAAIHRGIAQVIGEGAPDLVVVEELYSKYGHPKTAILMGHARGVVYLAAAAAGVPVESYTASQVKKSITGNGSATKEQMQRMICRVLNLAKPPKPSDVADALALAICSTIRGRIVATPRGQWLLPTRRGRADLPGGGRAVRRD